MSCVVSNLYEGKNVIVATALKPRVRILKQLCCEVRRAVRERITASVRFWDLRPFTIGGEFIKGLNRFSMIEQPSFFQKRLPRVRHQQCECFLSVWKIRLVVHLNRCDYSVNLRPRANSRSRRPGRDAGRDAQRFAL